MFVHVSERETFFSLNCSKFAVESDWNSKNSQNVRIFFGEIDGFFKIATCAKFFSRMRLKWYFFFGMSFILICEDFLTKFRKNLNLEKLESLMKEQSN